MNTLKLGILREGKIPPDKRVAFTPKQVEEILQRYPMVSILVQPSPHRCFSEAEYEALGAVISEDLSSCDVLLGIKEVPKDTLIPGKTYLFFSHTIKEQPYNRELLRTVLAKKVKLIDYEVLCDIQGNRLVAFGRYAGIVGAYNGLMAWGKRNQVFDLIRASDCLDINELKLQLHELQLPTVKIVLTGAGRVGRGAMETLDSAGIRKVSPEDFLTKQFSGAVYVQLNSEAYHERIEGGHFNRAEFHSNPERYRSVFVKFLKEADILMAGAFWNPKAPVLFTREDMLDSAFKLKVVSDITCDINGSVPSTLRASTIAEPFYDYKPETHEILPPFSDPAAVTVMAVDNLPCELPRSASDEFGRDLIDKILRPLLGDDHEEIISRATVAENGQLTEGFSYLKGYVAG